ncbi:MAG: hypothetical protein Q9217_001910 [Psora testacea]
MAFSISVGDVMLLSSLAWKIGRAFTVGRGVAPAEFSEVKNELEGLASAIVSLCNALEEDGSILASADDRTKEGLDTILDSCRQTLENLESLVNQYQDVIKPEGERGNIQRKWTSSFIRNYKKMWWTSEGGNIQDLRNMLQMHVQSITLTMQALQSKSLSRLERTVEPMAKQVEGLHNTVVGSIDVKIAEMHNLMMSMVAPANSPWLGPKRQGTSISTAETLVAESSKSRKDILNTPPVIHGQGPQETGKYFGSSQPSSEMNDSGFSSWSSPRLSVKRDERYSGPLPQEPCLNSPPGTQAPSITETRWSSFSDELPTSITDIDRNRRPSYNSRTSSSLGFSTLSPVLLPPPAVEAKAHAPSTSQREVDLRPIVPSQRYSTMAIMHPDEETSQLPCPQQNEDDVDDLGASLRKASTVSQLEAFQAMIFIGAATLCEAIGASVEYTQSDEKEEGGLKMVEACSTCKISIVTRGHAGSAGNIRYTSSIWALSDNRKVRLQHKCTFRPFCKNHAHVILVADDVEIIPYTLWGNERKVVVRMPAELKYHALSTKDKPLNTAKTNWINYIFKTERGAIEFQNALMGKRLLHTFRTRRTLRLFDSIVSTAFAYQEQLCGLENLRLWSDDDGGDGSVLAMIHYSANFKEGYLAFRLRGPYTTVQIKDDGEKWVKVKGLEVSLAASGTDIRALKRRKSSFDTTKSPKLKSEKKISGVKIEFENIVDKKLFLELYKIKPQKGRFIG